MSFQSCKIECVQMRVFKNPVTVITPYSVIHNFVDDTYMPNLYNKIMNILFFHGNLVPQKILDCIAYIHTIGCYGEPINALVVVVFYW